MKKMSEETDNTKEELRALRKLVEDQAIAFREFQEQQLATQVLQDQRIEAQGQTIAQLNAEIAATAAAATAAVAPTPETVVQTGDLARRWRLIFLLGALLPHSLAIGSLVSGDPRFHAASTSFAFVAFICSIVSAISNPRNIGSRNEKLCVGFCGLLPAAYVLIQAYLTGKATYYIVTCVAAPVGGLSYPAVVKLYSNLSDRKLGATVTALFKSIPSVLIPMLYISGESLRCIINASADAKLAHFGLTVEGCENPSGPTFAVSGFLFAR